jgi:hypothetical protein
MTRGQHGWGGSKQEEGAGNKGSPRRSDCVPIRLTVHNLICTQTDSLGLGEGAWCKVEGGGTVSKGYGAGSNGSRGTTIPSNQYSMLTTHTVTYIGNEIIMNVKLCLNKLPKSYIRVTVNILKIMSIPLSITAGEDNWRSYVVNHIPKCKTRRYYCLCEAKLLM